MYQQLKFQKNKHFLLNRHLIRLQIVKIIVKIFIICCRLSNFPMKKDHSRLLTMVLHLNLKSISFLAEILFRNLCCVLTLSIFLLYNIIISKNIENFKLTIKNI